MIVEEYTVICDGCGAWGSASETRVDAQHRAQADGWTTEDTVLTVAHQHWCPECTASRDEAGR